MDITNPIPIPENPIFWDLPSVSWIRIRIRKDLKLLAGSGSVTWGYGFGSGTGDAPYQKSSKNHRKICNLIIMTLKKR
jgi:hypothetical protein